VTATLLHGVNLEVVALFAALVLLEGLRRVPAGALVMRGTGPRHWRPLGEPQTRERWRLISWWSPVGPAIVLPPLEGPAMLGPADLEGRLQTARRFMPRLTAGAALTLLALVIGLPVASARYGAVGFLAGAAVVLALAVTNASTGALALRRLGSPARRIQVLAWCSPFAAGRVLESVYETALAGASPAQAVRALAGEEVFATWSRARAYDVVVGGVSDPDLCTAADEATLRRIIAARPAEPGAASFCPRCAATWLVAQGACPTCAVPLTRAK
jgi:hypothetical protein